MVVQFLQALRTATAITVRLMRAARPAYRVGAETGCVQQHQFER